MLTSGRRYVAQACPADVFSARRVIANGLAAEIARIDALGSQGYGVAFDLALTHVELGAHNAALDGLEPGMGDDSRMQLYLNTGRALDSLRGETRFRALSRKLGLG